MRISFLILAFSLLIGTSAQAHDEKLHKTPMLTGVITSLQQNKVSIKTDKEEVAITIMPDTKYEVGMDGKKAERGNLKEGQELMVMGHKLENGEFAAAEIIIHEKKDSHDHRSMN